MRRALVQAVGALLVVATASGAQGESRRISPRLAIGVTTQNSDYRAFLGTAARVGISGRLAPRLDWGADLTLERFGNGDGVSTPPCADVCPDIPDANTFGHVSAVLVLREEDGPNAYLVGGGGVSRLMTSRSSTRRTYAHVTGGVGWTLTRGGARPFLELRFNKYLDASDPMSAWSLPVLLGFHF